MKRTPLSRNTPLRSRSGLSRTTPVKPVSKAQRRRNARYAAARARVLVRDGGLCQRCQTFARRRDATDVHHMRGRAGADLYAEEYLVSLCRECHDWCGAFPAQAIADGWSAKRLRGTS